MKIILAIIMNLALIATLFAIDQMTIGISRILDEPTQDSQDMILKHKETQETFHVDHNVVLSDKDFKEMIIVEENDISIRITLTDEGAKKFAELTKEMIGKRLAIISNNQLLSTPIIQQQITGNSLQITGNMTKEEAEEIITLFKKGKNG